MKRYSNDAKSSRKDDTKRYLRSPDYVYRKIADADVLIPVGQNIARSNGYISLNKSAAVLWNTLQKPSTFADLVQALETAFEVDTEHAELDTRDFLDELINYGMVILDE